MSIVLHIERLVIDAAALGGERGGDLRVALERELARSLAQPGAIDSLRGLGAVAGLPAMKHPPAAQPRESSSARIASAVLRGLGLPATNGHGSATRHG